MSNIKKLLGFFYAKSWKHLFIFRYVLILKLFDTQVCRFQNLLFDTIIFLAFLEKLILPNWDAIREGWKHTKLHFYLLLIHYCCEWALVIYWRWIVNFPSWKSSFKVIHLTWDQSYGNHGILYIISNLPKVSIWRLKDFRICPCIAEKSTMLLFSGTFGHTVVLPYFFPWFGSFG